MCGHCENMRHNSLLWLVARIANTQTNKLQTLFILCLKRKKERKNERNQTMPAINIQSVFYYFFGANINASFCCDYRTMRYDSIPCQSCNVIHVYFKTRFYYSHFLVLDVVASEIILFIQLLMRDFSILPFAGMLISVFFIAAIILVYIFLPELHNLHGSCLVCHLAGLIVAYALTAWVKLNGWHYVDPNLCYFRGHLMYFALISAFLWSNVISFDLWRNFR